MGWDQAASGLDELGTFRYAIYVDGTRSEVADVSCGTAPGPNGFPCSGRLPAMSNGAHQLELATFIVDALGNLESARSALLRVTVTGAAAGAAAALADGDLTTTIDGVRLRAEVLFDGLSDPAALAVAPDGRAFIGMKAGLIVVKEGASSRPQLVDGAVSAVELSRTFAEDGHIFVIQTVPSADGAVAFRAARFLDLDGRLAQRMVILETGPVSSNPSAALRFGPDGKLYLAFDDGGNADAAERMSEWSGKVLRMEADGRTPDDQAAASPVLFAGLSAPRGIDFSPETLALWIADASRDGVERLRTVTSTSERPRRAGQRGTFVMPRGLGASALAFYKTETIGEFSGDLFIAGRDAGYILRVRFDRDDRSQPVVTERLLEGRVGSVRALAIGPDGAIYFCTDTALVRLRIAPRGT